MKKYIGDQIPYPVWARNDERYKRLDQFDKLLDGEFYDHLSYAYYQETDGNNYIKILRRRPCVRFNLFRMVSSQISRKLFGGRHAPTLLNENEEARLKIQALVEESELLNMMLQAVEWGSVGACAITFKVAVLGQSDGTKRAKLVPTLWRAKQCQPFFNDLRELDKLRVQYTLGGADLMAQGFTIDALNKPLQPNRIYWFIRDFTSTEEVTYTPIPENKWRPYEIKSSLLIPDENPEFQVEPHNLGFVPAQWFVNKQGTDRWYDGNCLWEDAIPNVIDLDYTLSQMGAGVRYNAAPQVIIKGKLITDETGEVVGGPSRYLQFEPDRKDPDGIAETGGGADLLEMTGNGIKIGIENYAAIVKELALKAVSASLKNPDKITTAMSGQAMETLDAEYYDLVQELRTSCGTNFYLKLVKKMVAAAAAMDHPLAEGLTNKIIDATTLGWPPMNDLGATEIQAIAAGLGPLVEQLILAKDEARDYFFSQVDMPVTSANKAYLETVKAKVSDKESTAPPAVAPVDDLLAAFEDAAGRATQKDPIDTTYYGG